MIRRPARNAVPPVPGRRPDPRKLSEVEQLAGTRHRKGLPTALQDAIDAAAAGAHGADLERRCMLARDELYQSRFIMSEELRQNVEGRIEAARLACGAEAARDPEAARQRFHQFLTEAQELLEALGDPGPEADSQ
jgi:hypothetical protein